MGVTASVRCGCLDARTASPPPVPWDRLRVEDGYLTDAGAAWNLAGYRYADETEAEKEARYAAERVLNEWQSTACPHPGMTLWDDQIGNWGMISELRHVLREHGGEGRWPVLLAELPTYNDGCLPADRVPAALAELGAFAELPHIGETTELLDAADGRVVRTRNPAHDWFHGNVVPGVHLALTETTLRAFGRETGETLFESARFRQAVLDPEPGDRILERPNAEPPARWTDAATGASVRLVAIGGRGPSDGREYPAELTVRRRPRVPADVHAVPPLRAALAAAADAGQPVWWG